MVPGDLLDGFQDTQHHPREREDQHDLLQGREQAAHDQGGLEVLVCEEEEEHEDQQSHRSHHERAQHRRQLACHRRSCQSPRLVTRSPRP